MRVPDIANRNVVATEVNLDICTIDPRALAAWVAAAGQICGDAERRLCDPSRQPLDCRR